MQQIRPSAPPVVKPDTPLIKNIQSTREDESFSFDELELEDELSPTQPCLERVLRSHTTVCFSLTLTGATILAAALTGVIQAGCTQSNEIDPTTCENIKIALILESVLVVSLTFFSCGLLFRK